MMRNALLAEWRWLKRRSLDSCGYVEKYTNILTGVNFEDWEIMRRKKDDSKMGKV